MFLGAREPGVHGACQRQILNLFSSNLLYFHLGDFVLDVVMYILTWHFCYCIKFKMNNV